MKTRRHKNSIWQSSPFGWDGISGVYCVCTGGLRLETDQIEPLKVWYVGATKNIRKRLTNVGHPYRILFGKGYWPFIRFMETSDYKKLEKRVISLLNPPMNKQHRRVSYNDI
jgi:excinuclease UvrABC nuclease subunit